MCERYGVKPLFFKYEILGSTDSGYIKVITKAKGWHFDLKFLGELCMEVYGHEMEGVEYGNLKPHSIAMNLKNWANFLNKGE